MVTMQLTPADYESEYWPRLEAAITQLLSLPPGEYIPISYEQMYSCVYKCVSKQFSERLYGDLRALITNHLQQLSRQLQQDAASQPDKYIVAFEAGLKQYLTALGGIVPIFNYMNRYYVAAKLNTDLDVELRKLFVSHVADAHISHLLPLLVEASAKPFAVPPPTMARLVTGLHGLKAEYASLRPQLFSRYLPNILPPCQADQLASYREETARMQRDLRAHPDFCCGDQRQKRPNEEEDAARSGPGTSK